MGIICQNNTSGIFLHVTITIQNPFSVGAAYYLEIRPGVNQKTNSRNILHVTIMIQNPLSVRSLSTSQFTHLSGVTSQNSIRRNVLDASIRIQNPLSVGSVAYLEIRPGVNQNNARNSRNILHATITLHNLFTGRIRSLYNFNRKVVWFTPFIAPTS